MSSPPSWTLVWCLKRERSGGNPPPQLWQLTGRTREDIETFQRDGAVCIRQLFQPHEIEVLRRGIDANLAHPSGRAEVASRADDPGFFIEDFCNWPHNVDYRRIARSGDDKSRLNSRVLPSGCCSRCARFLRPVHRPVRRASTRCIVDSAMLSGILQL